MARPLLPARVRENIAKPPNHPVSRTLAKNQDIWQSTTLWVMGKDDKVPAPAGMAMFPQELARPPREWGERSYNILRWEEMPRGGHFAAWEEPELLAQEVRAFFRQFR